MFKNKGNKVSGPLGQISFRIPKGEREVFVNHVKGRGLDVTDVMRDYVRDYLRKAGAGTLPPRDERSEINRYAAECVRAYAQDFADSPRSLDILERMLKMRSGTLRSLLEKD